jgi:5,10-methenyltetrahydromethanopterin hydrogenase
MSVHALTERAMVMNLSISLWQGYRLDKEASRKVTEDAGANRDAARVNKHLVPKEALAPVVTAANNVRSHFYDNTLPWRDNGDRLMTRKLFTTFIEAHEQLRREFDEAVSTFLDDKYPAAIAQAEFRMGDLFKREDYPSVEQLRGRFRIVLDIDAVTTSNDFRVAIDQEHVERVKASMEAAAERRVQQAQADVWKRLLERVGKVAERLGDPEAVFRDSTIDNVAELVELIPGLNVLDDPDIERMRRQIEDKLVGHDAKDIRKDPDLRAELAGDAKAIVDEMAGFMRAFGGGFE